MTPIDPQELVEQVYRFLERAHRSRINSGVGSLDEIPIYLNALSQLSEYLKGQEKAARVKVLEEIKKTLIERPFTCEDFECRCCNWIIGQIDQKIEEASWRENDGGVD